MRNDVTLRDARVEDGALLAGAERLVAAKPGYLASRPEELLDEVFRATIRRCAGGFEGKYLVAEIGGQVVGHAVVVPMALAATRHIVRLTIVVHPGHEGQGIGKQLLTALIEWARAAPGVRKIELNVRATNTRAIALYRSLGFEEQGRQLQRICIDAQTFIDDLEMGLFVKPRG
jgi:ribosomal protein S18 acetylase RimI-like enzyme